MVKSLDEAIEYLKTLGADPATIPGLVQAPNQQTQLGYANK